MSLLLPIVTLAVSIIMPLLPIVTIITYYYVFETGHFADETGYSDEQGERLVLRTLCIDITAASLRS